MEAHHEITASRAAEALEDFSSLALRRYPHRPLLERVWELRANVKTYDAAYLALAEALGCTLVTRDASLSGVRSVRCPVELLR
jgi:predicted nucleic acid-binding protein